MSMVSGIQGLPLEVTVVGCLNLKDKEWISRQDPYVCVEYATSRFRTKTCTDGGKNPSFQEKFVVNLIEGLREINLIVWNSNTLSADDLIGSGRVQLQKVLSQGFDDSAWTVMDKCGRYAGEVRLILHYAYANQSAKVKVSPSAPTYGYHSTSMAPAAPYAVPAMHGYPDAYPHKGVGAYPPPPSTYPPPPPNSTYPPATYPPSTAAYPPSTYPPPAGYLSYPPPAGYPYPPPPNPNTSCYPPGPPSGIYPPPPY